MVLNSIAANQMRELEEKANSLGIQKEDIVNIMQSKDGVFVLTYFSEE